MKGKKRNPDKNPNVFSPAYSALNDKMGMRREGREGFSNK